MRHPSHLIPMRDHLRVLDKFTQYLTFKKTTMERDLNTNIINGLLMWYPEFITPLYEAAGEKREWREVIEDEKIKLAFLDMFPETSRLLDKLKNNDLKLNHLAETKVNKKIK